MAGMCFQSPFNRDSNCNFFANWQEMMAGMCFQSPFNRDSNCNSISTAGVISGTTIPIKRGLKAHASHHFLPVSKEVTITIPIKRGLKGCSANHARR